MGQKRHGGAVMIVWLAGALGALLPSESRGQAEPLGEPVAVVYARPVPPPPPSEATTAVTFSAGWARLEGEGDSPIDGEDGYYFDTEFSFRKDTSSPLWMGVSFNFSYFEEEHDFQADSTLLPTEVDIAAQLSNFAIEPRITFVLLPRSDKGVYLAGKLGVGLLITDYWVTALVERPAGLFIDSEGDTVAAFEVRPGVQLGYSGGAWAVGAEVSNMWAWGDFGGLGDQLQETRCGVFFTLKH